MSSFYQVTVLSSFAKNDNKKTLNILPFKAFFCLWGTKKMDLRYWKNGFEPAWLLMKYLTNNRFAEQSYRVSSLFSLLSSLEKVA